MRIVVFFDLPVLTDANRRDYRKFRKYLIKNGFMMIQESVYCKLAPNSTAANIIVDNLRRNKPSNGIVQALRVTEKQYSKMDFIVGQKSGDVLNSDERIVVI